eukprot:CAMPEP_0168455370 /NCGR_PEP_ID=MMETSP0228-20121227/50715_1 /TAXON_ID=133427 /ORGANISM="Protoceratium reticulatum, Strain CCCM 535 (=CCMP 1889)" /LENGTH=40 /DNA_ID= /DNA_START= /DNA_END= /DNA_ORIENTATION=
MQGSTAACRVGHCAVEGAQTAASALHKSMRLNPEVREWAA